MDTKSLKRLVRRALAEDIGRGDLTTQLTVPPSARCAARLTAKQDGILSGMEPFRAVFEECRADASGWNHEPDGTAFSAGDVLASFEGCTGAILTGERTALNFVQRLSGVATLAGRFVKAVEGLNVQICDTRKTTPGLRMLEKEAVVDGGGHNHRFRLDDGILIKDNHIVAAGGIREAVARVKTSSHHLMRIEVEVRTVSECEEAIAAGADVILLDNMDSGTMQECVKLAKAKSVLTEASGNVTLDNVRQIGETGVDLISVGALTHSAPAVDVSLSIEQH